MLRTLLAVHCRRICFIVWVRCAGVYVFGALGSNSCPAGSVRIATEAACRTAASATQLTYSATESDSSFPVGCYHYFDFGSYVNFNTHSNGGGDRHSRPLCSPESSAGTTPGRGVAWRCRCPASGLHRCTLRSAAPTNMGDTIAPMTGSPTVVGNAFTASMRSALSR